jgi:hypothetical protein
MFLCPNNGVFKVRVQLLTVKCQLAGLKWSGRANLEEIAKTGGIAKNRRNRNGAATNSIRSFAKMPASYTQELTVKC